MMNRKLVAALVAFGLAVPAVARAQDAPVEEQIVNQMNKVFGVHAGFRANHAKGVMVTGTFTPAPTAPSLSKAPHFAKTVPVEVRFSDTTGVPNIPDASADSSPHGIAIRFKLDGGASTDIVSISANSFPVSNPDDFLALVRQHGIAFHEKKLGQQFCDVSSRQIIELLLRECAESALKASVDLLLHEGLGNRELELRDELVEHPVASLRFE